MIPEPDEQTKRLFETIITSFRKTEESARQDVIREIQKGENFWRGRQDIYWNSNVLAWQTAREAYEANLIDAVDLLDYDKYVNTYRAHGKSIIAASSVEFPKYSFLPQNFSKAIDLLASDTYSNIGEIIQRQNDGKRLFARAFFVRWNQHFVAIYNYHKFDKKYGEVRRESYGAPQQITEEKSYCPTCAAPVEPDASLCDGCGGMFDSPNIVPEVRTVVEKVVNFEPRGREILEVYGPKHVTIPMISSRMEDLPYLRLEQEFPISLVISELGKFRTKVDVSPLYTMEECLRLPASYSGTAAKNVVTVAQDWITPAGFWELGVERGDDVKSLLQKYPEGAKVISINSRPAFCMPEVLEEHWTIGISSTSDSFHDDPLGKDLIPLNEMQNEIMQQVIETIKQAIPELFADPDVLNFKAYGKVEKRPGTVSPASPRAGFGLDSAFFETRSATLPKEIETFSARLEQLAQLVVHAFPSIFGGNQQGGSQTYAEYAKSAQQALQVLGLDYTPIVDAFGKAMKKAIREFITYMQEEQYNYSYKDRGNLVNILIERSTTTGEVGEVDLESASQIPLSWAEFRAMIAEFIQTGNPTILAYLFHPENSTFVKDILGARKLYIPGEADRKKQLTEIEDMLNSGPQMQPQGQDAIQQSVMQPIAVSSVPIDTSDNHQIHIETITIWEVSDVGQEVKKNEPEVYQNIVLHRQAHMAALASANMPPPAQAGNPNNNGNGGPPSLNGPQATPPAPVPTGVM